MLPCRAVLDGTRLEGTRLESERIDVAADALELYELSLREGWGDGLPVLPPTEARVEALLAATSRASSDSVTVLPPRNGTATVEKIAVNAAMAGVEPAAFPYVLAAIEAISRPDHNLLGLTTTTSSATSYLIVNGPRRAELGFDCEAGCLGGGGGRGSMTVGRAVLLCLRNIGGQRAGATSKTVFGQPARAAGACFGEWEERSPWPSLAARRGLSAADEVITAHASKGVHAFADGNTRRVTDLLQLIAKTIAFPLGNAFHGSPARGQTVLLVNPVWAERFAAELPDVRDVQSVLFEHAWQPLSQWPLDNQHLLEERGRVSSGGRVMMHASPDQFVIVVCGGLGNLQAVALPTWGDSAMQSALVGRQRSG